MKVLRIVLILGLGSTAGQAQDSDQIAFAQRFLADLNPISIQAGREYCGYFGYDAQGRLTATRAKRGRADSCLPRDPGDLDVFASYHTHGSYAYEADSEIPSSDDVISDQEEGVDGFVVTPGGRLWFIDGARAEARLLCGLNCLPADPDHEPGFMGPIAKRYTLEALLARED